MKTDFVWWLGLRRILSFFILVIISSVVNSFGWDYFTRKTPEPAVGVLRGFSSIICFLIIYFSCWQSGMLGW
ncbi:hypothetical protein FEM41_12070 [Jejubacter calystegiae]|uniref:Uncharacterized protein n=1 Tax=Jejubacter calystegiae TaxID=2579935 RepID=A0A4P8YKW3_9ENTR|nr:hypothetical protein [Jejubacter calystegiae]QCT20334.1 hypothetical protein FEM41_12070 [Jejubacter calystegiae]